MIADADFFLETPTVATHVQQHVSGIPWLAARLDEGDKSWLMMDKVAPARQRGMYSARAKMDGTLSAESITRVSPMPAPKPHPTSPTPTSPSPGATGEGFDSPSSVHKTLATHSDRL